MITGLDSSNGWKLDKWESLIESGINEIEVSEQFQNLSADMIARTAFSNSYEEGKYIFNMQSEQMMFAAEAFQKIILPFSRWDNTLDTAISKEAI